MGGAVHRLEVLLVGLVLLLAAGLAVALTLLSPPPHAAYLALTPEPVAVQATAQPAATARPTDAVAAAGQADALPTVRWRGYAPPMLWDALALSLGLAGLGIALARHARRRMHYTGQSISMLLGASSRQTRADNLRVMRGLFAQGRLPRELAVAAGIARDWRLPALRLPMVALPPLPRVRLSIPAIPTTYLPHGTLPKVPALPRVQLRAPRWPELSRTLPPSPAEDAAAQEQAPAASDARWEAEDRALAVAGALENIWRERGLASPILALDTRQSPGDAPVLVTIDVAPDDEEALAALPNLLSTDRTGWSVRWQTARRSMAILRIDLPGTGARPSSGPLLAPALLHGQGHRTVRFLPLTTWRHLAIDGADAIHALHALLTSLLYAHAPDALAIAICDGGQVSPLYRGVAHCVTSPGDMAETAMQITSMLHGAPASERCRPLLLVAVEPNAAQLAALIQLLQVLRQRPDSPVHLLVVQARRQPAGQELAALLPALITGGGSGALLPGQGEWPRHGAARLVGRGMRLDGRPRTLDESGAGALIAPLRAGAAGLPPVLWERPATTATPSSEPACPPPTSPRAADWLSTLLTRDEGGAPDATAPGHRSPAGAQSPGADVEGRLPLSAGELTALIARALTSPAVTGGQEDQRGLSKRRLAELLELPQPRARALADVLIVWLDRAGVLHEPLKPGRLHHPRALRGADADAIVAALAATRVPDDAEVRAAWAASAQEAGVR